MSIADYSRDGWADADGARRAESLWLVWRAGTSSFDRLFGISWPIVFIVRAIVAILVGVAGIAMKRSGAKAT